MVDVVSHRHTFEWGKNGLTEKTNQGKGERDIAPGNWRDKKGKLRTLMKEVELVNENLVKRKGKSKIKFISLNEIDILEEILGFFVEIWIVCHLFKICLCHQSTNKGV